MSVLMCAHSVMPISFLVLFFNSWILPLVLNMRCQKVCLNSPMYSDSLNNMIWGRVLSALLTKPSDFLSYFRLSQNSRKNIWYIYKEMNLAWITGVRQSTGISVYLKIMDKNSFELLLSISVLQLFIDCFIDHNEDRSTWTKAENLRNHSFVKGFKPEI